VAIEQKVKFDPSRAERAFQQVRFADGWCASATKNVQVSQAPDEKGEEVSPNYIQLQMDVCPMEDPGNPETAVSRGMRKWQTLPFKPDHWDELLANGLINEERLAGWEQELDSSQKDCYRWARAWWPDDVPALPRRQGDDLVYDGEVIESSEYDAAANDAVSRGIAKLGEVVNADGFGACDGKVVYTKLGNATKAGPLSKRTYVQLTLGDHPNNMETGEPEVLNQGANLYYRAKPAAPQADTTEEETQPTKKPQPAAAKKPQPAPAKGKPTTNKKR
jgi:hypothetical protein